MKKKHMQFGRPILLIGLAAYMVFGLVFCSWGTVYAAQDSLPGDLLYSVKLTQEELQLAFTSGTEARIRLLTSYADRRAEEAAALALQGQPVPEQLSALMDEYIQELLVLTADLDEGTQQELLKGVQQHLRDQDQDMTGPKHSPVHNEEDLPPRTMNKYGTGQVTTDTAVLEVAIPLTDPLADPGSRLDDTPEISVTLPITPGTHGPGPCNMPDCTTPLADEHHPGPYTGDAPGPDSHEGYGPGFIQGQSPQQPAAEAPKQMPVDGGDGNAQGKQ